MLHAHGYVSIIGDRVLERDTITCGHCNQIILVKPGFGPSVYLIPSLHVDPITKQYTMETHEEPGAMCRCCMTPVCLACHAKGVCTPLMQRIEQMEARGRFLHAVTG